MIWTVKYNLKWDLDINNNPIFCVISIYLRPKLDLICDFSFIEVSLSPEIFQFNDFCLDTKSKLQWHQTWEIRLILFELFNYLCIQNSENCLRNFVAVISNPIRVLYHMMPSSGLLEAGGQGAIAHNSDFDRSVNPISTWGTDYTHHIITCPPTPLDFQTFLRSCDFFMMSHDASKRDFF